MDVSGLRLWHQTGDPLAEAEICGMFWNSLSTTFIVHGPRDTHVLLYISSVICYHTAGTSWAGGGIGGEKAYFIWAKNGSRLACMIIPLCFDNGSMTSKS